MLVRFVRSLSPHTKGKEVNLPDKQAQFLIKHKVVEAIGETIEQPKKAYDKPKKTKKEKTYKTKVMTAE